MGFKRDPLAIARALRDYIVKARHAHLVVWSDDEFIAVLASDATHTRNLCTRSYVLGVYNHRIRLTWLADDVQEALKEWRELKQQ